MSDECLPLFSAEVAHALAQQKEPKLEGRILVLAAFGKPCRGKPFTTHGTVHLLNTTGFQRLFGWEGFQQLAPDLPSRSSSSASGSAAVPPAATEQNQSLVEQWAFVKRTCKLDGDWVQLNSFLRAHGRDTNQSKHDYVTGGNAWRLGDGVGRKLVDKRDYASLTGTRGGVPGTYVKGAVVERVVYKYFAKLVRTV